MDVMAMKRQGMSIKEIAEETGYHPEHHQRLAGATAVRPRSGRAAGAGRDRRALGGRDRRAVARPPVCLATSVFELIKAEGYDGLLCRAWPGTCNSVRGPRFTAAPAASTRIVTAPGEECPVRLVRHLALEEGMGTGRGAVLLGHLVLVAGADLVVRPLDRPRAHLRGPGPLLRVRRRGAQGGSAPTAWGRSGPPRDGASPSIRRRSPSPSSTASEIKACQARDAKRKGKVERPFRDVKERFLEECNATGATSEHRRAQRAGPRRWLARADPLPAAPRHRSEFPPSVSSSRPRCSGPCRAGASTRPMSRPAGCTWPSRRSNGAACATRSRRAVWANGSRCARRSEGRASRSAGPAELVATHRRLRRRGHRGVGRRPLRRHPGRCALAHSGPPPGRGAARRCSRRDRRSVCEHRR